YAQRGAQKATREMGRVSPKDPDGLSGPSSSTTAPVVATQDKLLCEEGHLTVPSHHYRGGRRGESKRDRQRPASAAAQTGGVSSTLWPFLRSLRGSGLEPQVPDRSDAPDRA